MADKIFTANDIAIAYQHGYHDGSTGKPPLDNTQVIKAAELSALIRAKAKKDQTNG